MNLAEQLIATADRDVDVGPFRFRLRRVLSSTLASRGVAALVVAAETLPGGRRKTARAAKEGKAKIEEMVRSILTNPTTLIRNTEFVHASIAAAVVAVSGDAGVTWEPLTITLDPAAEDPANRVVHVSSLPPGAEAALMKAINELSDQGAYGRAVCSFRGA